MSNPAGWQRCQAPWLGRCEALAVALSSHPSIAPALQPAAEAAQVTGFVELQLGHQTCPAQDQACLHLLVGITSTPMYVMQLPGSFLPSSTAVHCSPW